MRFDEELAALAARQHGMISRRQCCEVGMASREFPLLVRSGWELLSERVAHRLGAPVTGATMLEAHVLDVGNDAAAGHGAAASWWGFPGFRDARPSVVTTSRSRRRGSMGTTHIVRELPSEWVTELRGIRIVRPELAILHICATEHERKAERALDNAWNLRLLSGPSLSKLLAQQGRRGRNGTAVLRQLMEHRGSGYIPPASNLEARAVEVLAPLGLDLIRQADLGSEQWTGRVDLWDRTRGVVIEIQSEMFHSALADRRSDTARRDQLERDGFVVVELTDVELWSRPIEARAKLGRALTSGRSVLRGVTDP